MKKVILGLCVVLGVGAFAKDTKANKKMFEGCNTINAGEFTALVNCTNTRYLINYSNDYNKRSRVKTIYMIMDDGKRVLIKGKK
jgi:hypothetical protein